MFDVSSFPVFWLCQCFELFLLYLMDSLSISHTYTRWINFSQVGLQSQAKHVWNYDDFLCSNDDSGWLISFVLLTFRTFEYGFQELFFLVFFCLFLKTSIKESSRNIRSHCYLMNPLWFVILMTRFLSSAFVRNAFA